MDLRVNQTWLRLRQGELAFQEADAIIHPTNNYLWFSSGASERLKQRGGDNLETLALELGPIEVGQAVHTRGNRLKAKVLIHAAAWGQDMIPTEATIHQAVIAALLLASQQKCRTVVLPVVGAGLGNLVLPQAIAATFMAVVEHAMQPGAVKEIVLLAANPKELDGFTRVLASARAANPERDDQQAE